MTILSSDIKPFKMDKVNMVPGFILKLWKMINDPECDDLISWSDNGQSFIIMDSTRFSQELSKYFKHNNLSSFIRQLNMYGFRKVATIENSGLHSGTDDLHFYHPDFVKDKPERLDAIKRKLPQKVAESVDLRNVIRGISEIEDKQKNVSKTLTEIKRENEMLWAELHDLRQKHQQQQLYISRLMKLVFEAMEQNGIKTNMLQLKRNSPLMIEGGEGAHAEKKSKLVSPDAATSYEVPIAESFSQFEQRALEQPLESILDNTPSNTDQHDVMDDLETQNINSPNVQNLSTNMQLPTNNLVETSYAPSYPPSFQNIVENINNNGDQIDSLVPSIMDFSDQDPDNTDILSSYFSP